MGTYKITECKNNDLYYKYYEKQAKINKGLQKRPTLKILESSLKALTAFNISINTKTDKLRVEAFDFP